MKLFLRTVIALPVIGYYAIRDRGFRAWLRNQKPAPAKPHTLPGADKLTLAEDIECHVAAVICGTAKAAETIVLFYLNYGFWNIIREIYKDAFRREVEVVLERRIKP